MSRSAPGRNNDKICFDFLYAAFFQGDVDAVRFDELGLAIDRCNPVARELHLKYIGLVLDNVLTAKHQVGNGDMLFYRVRNPVDVSLKEAGKVKHCLAQGLARYGAGIHQVAANEVPPLYGDHRLSQLRRLYGSAVAGRSGANDYQISFLHAVNSLLSNAS